MQVEDGDAHPEVWRRGGAAEGVAGDVAGKMAGVDEVGVGVHVQTLTAWAP